MTENVAKMTTADEGQLDRYEQFDQMVKTIVAGFMEWKQKKNPVQHTKESYIRSRMSCLMCKHYTSTVAEGIYWGCSDDIQSKYQASTCPYFAWNSNPGIATMLEEAEKYPSEKE